MYFPIILLTSSQIYTSLVHVYELLTCAYSTKKRLNMRGRFTSSYLITIKKANKRALDNMVVMIGSQLDALLLYPHQHLLRRLFIVNGLPQSPGQLF